MADTKIVGKEAEGENGSFRSFIERIIKTKKTKTNIT